MGRTSKGSKCKILRMNVLMEVHLTLRPFGRLAPGRPLPSREMSTNGPSEISEYAYSYVQYILMGLDTILLHPDQLEFQNLNTLTNMAANSFEEKTSEFLAWFKGQPGTTFHENIQIQDLRSRSAGRGISESPRHVRKHIH